MNQLNFDQIPDPIQLLPKEAFVQIFSHLQQEDIDSSSKVSRDWRSSIQSDVTLFTSIEVTDDERFFPLAETAPSATFWEQERAKLEGMRMTIGKLSRLANLSKNRLKQVLIGLSPFGGCMPRTAGSWRFSRLSVVFDILTLSSTTLTRLHLDFPEMTPTEESMIASRDYIRTMLSKLESFPHLKEVELKALPLSRLVSKSEKKELTLSSYRFVIPNEPLWCFSCHSEWTDSLGAVGVSNFLRLNSLIKEMNAFTEGQLVQIASNKSPPYYEHGSFFLNDAMLRGIQGCAGPLQTLDIQVDDDSLLQFEEVVITCQNLLSLEVSSSATTSLEFFSDFRPFQKSNIKNLQLSCRKGRIVLNDSMMNWIGIQLEHINLLSNARLMEFNPSLSLHQLIQNVSSTLKSIDIHGAYDFFPPHSKETENFTILTALRKLSLSGNFGLINGFTSNFQSRCLVELKIESTSPVGPEDNEVKLPEIYDLVRLNSISLEILHLQHQVRPKTSSQTDQRSEKPFDLPSLKVLSLTFCFEGDKGAFSRSNLPQLKRLYLCRALEASRDQFRSRQLSDV